MENDIKSKKYKVSGFDDFVFSSKEDEDDIVSKPKVDIFSEESVKIDFSFKELITTVEDSGEFFGDIFEHRDVILNEKWDISENVQRRNVFLKWE